MPLYEYECDACGSRFEVIRKFSDPHLDTCRRCGSGPVRRLFSSPAIQFKGTGWYITDYAQKGKSAGERAGGDANASKDGTTGKEGGDAKAPAAADTGGSKSESKAAATTTTTPTTTTTG
jgi:putative FmdB family regulatory protein